MNGFKATEPLSPHGLPQESTLLPSVHLIFFSVTLGPCFSSRVLVFSAILEFHCKLQKTLSGPRQGIKKLPKTFLRRKLAKTFISFPFEYLCAEVFLIIFLGFVHVTSYKKHVFSRADIIVIKFCGML